MATSGTGTSENELSNPWEPTIVNNMDVVGTVERLDRYCYDILRFESSRQNVITEFDLARIRTYIDASRIYVDTLNNAPSTDNPFSYPGQYTIVYLTKDYNFAETKNKAIRDIVRMWVNTWVNMSRSESADRSNGFSPFDVTRFNLNMDRMTYYLDQYVIESLPLDLPESSQFQDAQSNTGTKKY
jgi:hypothetical protein